MFCNIEKSYIFASHLRENATLIGRLAQLVQSICLTSRGSAVRIRQRPPEGKKVERHKKPNKDIKSVSQ